MTNDLREKEKKTKKLVKCVRDTKAGFWFFFLSYRARLALVFRNLLACTYVVMWEEGGHASLWAMEVPLCVLSVDSLSHECCFYRVGRRTLSN